MRVSPNIRDGLTKDLTGLGIGAPTNSLPATAGARGGGDRMSGSARILEYQKGREITEVASFSEMRRSFLRRTPWVCLIVAVGFFSIGLLGLGWVCWVTPTPAFSPGLCSSQVVRYPPCIALRSELYPLTRHRVCQDQISFGVRIDPWPAIGCRNVFLLRICTSHAIGSDDDL